MASSLGVILIKFGQINTPAWGGVALLLIGAGLGFGADALGAYISPNKPEYTVYYRLAGLTLALIGALWAMRIWSI